MSGMDQEEMVEIDRKIDRGRRGLMRDQFVPDPRLGLCFSCARDSGECVCVEEDAESNSLPLSPPSLSLPLPPSL